MRHVLILVIALAAVSAFALITAPPTPDPNCLGWQWTYRQGPDGRIESGPDRCVMWAETAAP
jgi:hypothetical protein